MQGGEGFDLGPNVGRGVEQEPAPVVGAHRHRRLRARTAGPRAVAHGAASGATAVPLRKSSARGRSEHSHPHTRPPSNQLEHTPNGNTAISPKEKLAADS